MLPFTLEQLHAATGGELTFASSTSGRALHEPIGRIVTDSRHVQPGDVFWALRGTWQDGADFIEQAVNCGAVGVVSHRLPAAPLESWTIRVEDSLSALHGLASWRRDRFPGRVVAVTGSVGKTTTRMMIECVLARGGSGTSSAGNYNNHIGLPLSMLPLAPEDAYGVFELGASAAGEISQLARLCRPDVGVITSIGEAHLASFGSRAAVADAKAELLDALPPSGAAVLNGDDDMLRRVAHRSAARVVWVGRSGTCDVRATNVAYQEGVLQLKVDGMSLAVPVWGRHYVTAVLLALAVAREFGVPDAQSAEALMGFKSPRMRCQIDQLRGATVINDAYNASPAAMRAALDLLAAVAARGQRIVVCGDMRELGPETPLWHLRLGSEVVSVGGADRLVACGHFAPEVVAGARRAGMDPAQTIAFRHVEDAARHVEQIIEPGDVVLVKGSRIMGMERIVEHLAAPPLRRAA